MTVIQNFKQFFTPAQYSQIIIEALNINSPQKIIDLAIGEGSLLLQAMQKWPSSNYYGNDIDPKCCEKICFNHTNIECYNDDIFFNSTIINLINNIGKVDLCLGNPPFNLIEQNSDIQHVLKLFDLDQIYKSKFIPCEIVFILQCLRILNNDGHLALILPDGFFVNSSLRPFRSFLINSYSIEKIIELPKNIFRKTQAKTHIIILKNTKPLKNTIVISSVECNYQEREITLDNALNRMDYSFYALHTSLHNTSLAALDVTFVRGKPRHKLQDMNEKFILHTTNFSKGKIFNNQLSTTKKLSKHERVIAVPGDIILSRVGTNSVGKVGIVNKGYFIITDCVFIIRADNKKLQEIIYQALSSEHGQQWIKAHTKGVAARHITLTDIQKFPLTLENIHAI